MPEKPISHIQIHRALKVILGINYNYHFLDAYITPEVVSWYFALQFRNDETKTWRPRSIMFYPKEQRVAVFDAIGSEPTIVSAQTIIFMAESRAQTPTPPVTAG